MLNAVNAPSSRDENEDSFQSIDAYIALVANVSREVYKVGRKAIQPEALNERLGQ